MDELSPTLNHIINSPSLKWIFVGGKGGVGKTTCSSSLACLLAQKNPSRKYIIVSTDPAHNLSDAFDQKFSGTATPVAGIPNLSALEIDPNTTASDSFSSLGDLTDGSQISSMMSSILGVESSVIEETLTSMKDSMGNMPGVNELMSFVKVVELTDRMEFDVVLFDTAPTGHTLQLLAIPTAASNSGGGGGVMSLASRLFDRFSGFLGSSEQAAQMKETMASRTETINRIREQFANPDLTTFIAVCIPEFLSVYETERLVQGLSKIDVDCSAIIVNQIVVIPRDAESSCKLCVARRAIQQKYLEQVNDLYADFHVVRIPLGLAEVRGVEALCKFGHMMHCPVDTS